MRNRFDGNFLLRLLTPACQDICRKACGMRERKLGNTGQDDNHEADLNISQSPKKPRMIGSQKSLCAGNAGAQGDSA